MKHNSYFEGKVQSLALSTKEGPATVGVIEPGQYTFSTDCEEHMLIVSGAMRVKLPGEASWRKVSRGDSFIVPPNKSFDIDAEADVAYICHYKR